MLKDCNVAGIAMLMGCNAPGLQCSGDGKVLGIAMLRGCNVPGLQCSIYYNVMGCNDPGL